MDKKQIRIGTPCSVDWASMTRSDKGRFCADCKKVVHDLSSMTERQAKGLLAESDKTSMCVRFVYDREGKVFFQPETLVSPSLLVRAKRAVLVAAAVASQGCQPGTLGIGGDDTEMGDVEVYTPSMGAIDVADQDAGRPIDEEPDASASDAATDAAEIDGGTEDAGEDASVPHT